MATLSTIAQQVVDGLSSATEGGLVEEYQIGRGIRRVKRGPVVEQVKAMLMLDAIASRQSSGLFRKAKLRSDRPAS